MVAVPTSPLKVLDYARRGKVLEAILAPSVILVEAGCFSNSGRLTRRISAGYDDGRRGAFWIVPVRVRRLVEGLVWGFLAHSLDDGPVILEAVTGVVRGKPFFGELPVSWAARFGVT